MKSLAEHGRQRNKFNLPLSFGRNAKNLPTDNLLPRRFAQLNQKNALFKSNKFLSAHGQTLVQDAPIPVSDLKNVAISRESRGNSVK